MEILQDELNGIMTLNSNSPKTKALMMMPEMEVPMIKRRVTYTRKFGAKAAATPNTVCIARDKSRANLLPNLKIGKKNSNKHQNWARKRNMQLLETCF